MAGRVPAKVGLADERGLVEIIGGEEQGHGLFRAEIYPIGKIPETEIDAQEYGYYQNHPFAHEVIIRPIIFSGEEWIGPIF